MDLRSNKSREQMIGGGKPKTKIEKKVEVGPIQHSIVAHGDILITSGGSTLMFKHTSRATQPVFIWGRAIRALSSCSNTSNQLG